MRFFLSAVLLTTIVVSGCEKTKHPYKTYFVNSASSVATWKGSAPDHYHLGSFQVKGAISSAANGTVKEGSFVIPISSIKNFDLPDLVKDQLLNHLKTADFFDIALHPNAAFEITKVQEYTGKDGIAGSNKLVTGDLTLRGKSVPIMFPAKINYVADSIKIEATLKIDRSKWGMTKYTDSTAADYILPNADIELKIQAGLKQ